MYDIGDGADIIGPGTDVAGAYVTALGAHAAIGVGERGVKGLAMGLGGKRILDERGKSVSDGSGSSRSVVRLAGLGVGISLP